MKLKIILIAEIKERELMSKRLNKYIASYFDSLIVLFPRTRSISIASFGTITRGPVENVSASFSLAFSISTGIVKKLL